MKEPMLPLWRHQWSTNFTDSSTLNLFLFTCLLWNPPHWVQTVHFFNLNDDDGRVVPQIWSEQQEELINCTLKQVTLEWKGCSWPRALSWQLFLLWWGSHPKLLQDLCENGTGSWIFVLNIYVPRFYGLWRIFSVPDCSCKRY